MKRKQLIISLLCFCVSAIAQSLFAQHIPVQTKFGSVSKEELELTSYDLDTSAVALYLYKNYEVEVAISPERGGFVQRVNVHDRIKILKEAGKKYADYEFHYIFDNDVKEEFKGLKVETYNLEDGNIVKTKMSKKYKFDEKFADGVRRLAFTAENVKVGSVIEVTYTFETPRYSSVDDIMLQSSIPINFIETSFARPQYFTFNKTQRSTEPVEYKQDAEVSVTYFGSSSLSYTVYTDFFTARDMPALQDESFCYKPSQYLSRIIYDIRGVHVPGVYNRDFNANWATVDQQLVEAGLVKECFAKFKEKEALEAAISGIEDEEEKIVAIRNFVTDRVKWDDNVRKLPGSVKDALKKGIGNSADINVLTASALNACGFLAEPVLLRRRTSGNLVIIQVTASAYDAMILKITSPASGKEWYLDAVRRDGYLNVLAPHYLVSEARLINKSGIGMWVDLTSLYKSKVNEVVTGEINADGLFAGTSKISAQGSDSYVIKDHYHDAESEEAYLEEQQNDEGLEELTDFTIESGYSPATAISYNFEKEFDKSGDLMYVKPFLSTYIPDSAFRKEKRKIPVDFPYPYDIAYTCMITIPEGWAVEEMPASISLSCPPVNGKIIFTCQNITDKIIVRYHFTLNSRLIQPEEYPDLRAFWEQAVNTEKSVIVLKKNQ